MTSRSSVCVVVKELKLWPPSRSVGEDIAAAGSRACGRGAGNGSQVFTASMLTVLRLLNLIVALAAAQPV